MSKALQILAISHMFPTVRSGQYGAFICREAQVLQRHEIEYDERYLWE